MVQVVTLVGAILMTFATALLVIVTGVWRGSPRGGGSWRGILLIIPAVLAMAMVTYATIDFIGK